MIKSFKHEGLQHFFEYGSQRGINAGHAPKLARILDRLDASRFPKDMNLPGYKLHRLTGKDKGTWAVRVSGNWRVTFDFENDNAVDVNYIDSH